LVILSADLTNITHEHATHSDAGETGPVVYAEKYSLQGKEAWTNKPLRTQST